MESGIGQLRESRHFANGLREMRMTPLLPGAPSPMWPIPPRGFMLARAASCGKVPGMSTLPRALLMIVLMACPVAALRAWLDAAAISDGSAVPSPVPPLTQVSGRHPAWRRTCCGDEPLLRDVARDRRARRRPCGSGR